MKRKEQAIFVIDISVWLFFFGTTESFIVVSVVFWHTLIAFILITLQILSLSPSTSWYLPETLSLGGGYLSFSPLSSVAQPVTWRLYLFLGSASMLLHRACQQRSFGFCHWFCQDEAFVRRNRVILVKFACTFRGIGKFTWLFHLTRRWFSTRTRDGRPTYGHGKLKTQKQNTEASDCTSQTRT